MRSIMFSLKMKDTLSYIEKCSSIDGINPIEKRIILSSIFKLKKLSSIINEMTNDELEEILFSLNHSLKKIIRKYSQTF